jgi:hypothetical protein
MRPHNKSVYVKKHGPSAVADFRRIQLLVNVCSHVDGLITASPIWIDAERGEIGYERLDHLRPIMRNSRNLADRMQKVGVTLAKFHKTKLKNERMNANDSDQIYPLTSFGLPEEDVLALEKHLPFGMFHGDCWHGNFLETAGGDLVLLDPLPNLHLVNGDYTSACGAIDVAMLYMSVFFCHSAAKHMLTPLPTLIPVGNVFLDGYLEEIAAFEARAAILRLSRIIAYRHVTTYKNRLSPPVAFLKERIGHGIIKKLDPKLAWSIQ